MKKSIQAIFILCILFRSFHSFALSEEIMDHNIIFFGDSLVDTGNYPESSNVHHPTLKNFNLYVPVSNPVSSEDSGLSKHFLEESLGDLSSRGKIDGQSKTLYSANWPLYFTHQVSSHPLIPSYRLQEDNIDPHNINYAWAGAVTGDPSGVAERDGACYHTNGTSFSGKCDAHTILDNKNLYISHTKSDPNFDKNTNYLYNDLQVPDLGKQVSLYLNDHSVALRDNTEFFIGIGNNDIGNFLKKNILGIAIHSTASFQNIIDQNIPLFVNNIKTAVQRIEDAYKGTSNRDFKICIPTLMHLSNLHIGYSYTHPSIFGLRVWIPIISDRIKAAIDNSADTYNHNLETVFANDPHVQIIHTGDFLNTLAKSAEYKDSIEHGRVCINDSSYTAPDTTHTKNCHYVNNGRDVTYYNWNKSHLTSPVNKSLAQYVAKALNIKQ